VFLLKIADRILQLCSERGISANKLAALSDMTQSTLADIIKGKNVSPRVSTIEKICEGLGISLSDFFLEANLDNNNNEIDTLPPDAQKELDLFKKFLIYKQSIKKPTTEK
jgi:transcriptional regulator with XRE-family HTH domain